MKILAIESWILLCSFERAMRSDDFHAIYYRVKNEPTQIAEKQTATYDAICDAVDLACVFYFKHVLCLQRSAATAVLLRRYGYHAEMVIGVQVQPLKSHAWVELAGQVMNDKPYMAEMYQVLERC